MDDKARISQRIVLRLLADDGGDLEVDRALHDLVVRLVRELKEVEPKSATQPVQFEPAEYVGDLETNIAARIEQEAERGRREHAEQVKRAAKAVAAGQAPPPPVEPSTAEIEHALRELLKLGIKTRYKLKP